MGGAKLSLREIKLIKAEQQQRAPETFLLYHIPRAGQEPGIFITTFQREGEKEKKYFTKALPRPQLRMPCCTTKICERSAFQGVKNPACGNEQAFYIVGGVRKTTTVLH